ncbi:MAG TPA: alpha/beta hydrolase, partial [Methylomirabilota bacterium]|nr:alpha/beta hydrolase [Methylomirabilota bacterium]
MIPLFDKLKGAMQPATKYAQSGDLNIAYQTVGAGPLDLVFVMGWVSNIDEFWTDPPFARFLNRLAAFSRLIVFDKRGTGLSDRVDEHQLPTLEQRMDDVRAVMDAVGSHRAALLGISEGGPMSALFAATYPERTAALMTFGSYACSLITDDYPWGRSAEARLAMLNQVRSGWGNSPVGLDIRVPSRSNDQAFRDWWTRYLTRSATPRAALALTEMNFQIDVCPILPAIRVPALIMHRTGDRALAVEGSRYIARQIPGAKYVEYEGADHLPWAGDT